MITEFDCKSGKISARKETSAEIAAMQEEAAQAEAEEKRRPLSFSEVQEMLVRQHINTIAVENQTALRMRRYYPTFSELVGLYVELG